MASSSETPQRGRGFWIGRVSPIWVFGFLNTAVLAIVVALLFTVTLNSNPSMESAGSTRSVGSKQINGLNPSLQVETSLDARYLEQLQLITGLLKDALTMVLEQRKEISDLRNQLILKVEGIPTGQRMDREIVETASQLRGSRKGETGP